MTPLARRLAGVIAATGPVSLADYMAACLGDPRDGYYAREHTIGARGDFVTAPQVSQMFGELVGVWCVSAWHAMGRPDRFPLAEAGPGHGAMLADALRATRQFAGFAGAIDLRLVETSAAMIDRQRAALEAVDPALAACATWHAAMDELPPGPMLLVANEFLDALPVRQFVKSGKAWHERCVGLDRDGALRWVLGPSRIDPSRLPAGADQEGDGAVFEWAPAREAWIAGLAQRLARDGGMALLVDYGHAQGGFGDTFQAMRGHAAADPLAEPGLADLTSHVDFAALARAAAGEGAQVSPIVEQGDFLLAMGLLERAGALGANADEAVRERLRGEVARLAHPDRMGRLFKVLALSGPLPGPAAETGRPGLPPFSSPGPSDVKGS